MAAITNAAFRPCKREQHGKYKRVTDYGASRAIEHRLGAYKTGETVAPAANRRIVLPTSTTS